MIGVSNLDNTILWILLAVAVLYIVRTKFFMFSSKDVKNLSAEEAYKLINDNKNLIILDVRTKGEFESGHIPKAKNIPVQQLASRLNELAKYKDTPILVHCASGGRSPSAVRLLVKNQFTQLYHLKRGLMSWKYPLK